MYALSSPAISGRRIPPYNDDVVSRAPTGAVSAAQQRRLNDVLRATASTAGLPSISAAVATPGGVAWAGSYGWAEIDPPTPANPDDRYRTGSMAKSITAVAMMRLVEQGRLDLDTPLGSSIAGLPEATRAVTPRQLASHTAGIRHYTLAEGALGTLGITRPRHYASVQDGLQVFLADPLRFPPGTGFLYSTYGYSLLSRRLEVAAGRPFGEVLSEQVFTPCGMTSTEIDSTGAPGHRASFYRTGRGSYQPAKPVDSSNRIAGGGLISTPTDLARFGMCVFDGGLVSDASKTAMWTPVVLPGGQPNPQNYGLGWRSDLSVRLFGKERPTPILHHGGQQEGGAGFLLIVPSLRLSVSVMTNTGTDEAREAAQEAAYALVRAYAAPK